MFHVKHFGNEVRFGKRSTWNKIDVRPNQAPFHIGTFFQNRRNIAFFRQEIQKFSTNWRFSGPTGRRQLQHLEALALHGVATIPLFAAQEAFHSSAGFSTMQAAILKSPFPLV